MRRIIPISFLAIAISLCCINCDSGTKPDDSFTRILFERAGASTKAFYATTNPGHEIILNITKYDFKDTNYTVTTVVEDSGQLSDLITNVINRSVSITGDFKQPSLPTGTWAYLYAVSNDNKRTEITNIEIRDRLLSLETLVEHGR